MVYSVSPLKETPFTDTDFGYFFFFFDYFFCLLSALIFIMFSPSIHFGEFCLIFLLSLNALDLRLC